MAVTRRRQRGWPSRAGFSNSAASAAAISRRDTSTRAASASASPIRPAGAVALDFVQLVAVNGDVAAAAQRLVPGQRPQHGEDRRRRHQCKHQPKFHGVILSGKPLDLLPEKTFECNSVGMTAAHAGRAFLSTGKRLNPLMHIKASIIFSAKNAADFQRSGRNESRRCHGDRRYHGAPGYVRGEDRGGIARQPH